jgi:lipopolysaccharide assembly outer membrane protein LptD (OstA)
LESCSDQGEFRIKAAILKKKMTLFISKKACFTTSSNIENPEYYFQTNKVKFIPGKKVVTGLTNMVIANVPRQLLPFAYFPMSKETSIRTILPSYNDSNTRGFCTKRWLLFCAK